MFLFIIILFVSTAVYAQDAIQTSDIVDTPVEIVEPEFQLLDEIVVVIYGKEAVGIITKSDIDRPGLNGEQRTLDDLIFEHLVFLDAKAHGITVSDDEVDRYLETIQRDNNLTHENLEQIFAASGYTFEEGRELFKRMQTVSMMLDFKVRSKLIIRRKDVQKYYDEHPEYQEAEYLISRAVVDNATQQDVTTWLADDACAHKISWSSPVWLQESEIAQDKLSITKLKTNEIITITKSHNSVELYKLLEKKERRLRDIDERFHEISRILQRPYYEQLMQEYKDSLKQQMTVSYLRS